jgi:hypothetical protein
MNNEIPVCLHREDDLCNARDQERIKNPGDKREQKKDNNRRFYLVPDYRWDGSNIHRNTASYIMGCPKGSLFRDMYTFSWI